VSSSLQSKPGRRTVLIAVSVGIVLLLVVSLKSVRGVLIRALGGVAPTTESATTNGPGDEHAEGGHDDHAGHDHGHAGHAEENSIELSEQARKSIGLTEGEAALTTFHRTITVPGMVVERAGRSRFNAIAPMTGFLTQILVTEGEAVAPGQPLFEIRLTHEELVQAQADLLRTTVQIEVVNREIARLTGISEGLVATKVILERKYELQNLEAVQLAQRQALLLHGLTEAQVSAIMKDKQLLGSIVVQAPAAVTADAGGMMLVQRLSADRGQHVTAGDTIAVLVNHTTLLVEGDAFEQDVAPVTAAASAGKKVTAILDAAKSPDARIEGLGIAYVADRVDPESRTLRFFVTLPNAPLIREARGEGEQEFVGWRFKPGQRMRIEVPVEEWPERIVLPATAVAQDGVENYVFRANGNHFDRAAVHVEYRDPQWVVVANDGTLFPGDRIAMTAAQQLQLALKNKAGGGIDPHAGHNH
jgi:multidrug efflux pump subunit AcrA (membrane-fusion protein)